MPSILWPRILGIVALLVALTGCSSVSRLPLSDGVLDNSSTWTIEGYSTKDGVFHGFEGKARWLNAARDTLELDGNVTGDVHGADPSGDTPSKNRVILHLARADVGTLLYWGTDQPKSTLLGVGLIGVFLAAVVAVGVIVLVAEGSSD